jgi:hypothetical protein
VTHVTVWLNSLFPGFLHSPAGSYTTLHHILDKIRLILALFTYLLQKNGENQEN